MSHTVQVNLIADQEIELLGKPVNIHDIISIVVDARGSITNACVRVTQTRDEWLRHETT